MTHPVECRVYATPPERLDPVDVECLTAVKFSHRGAPHGASLCQPAGHSKLICPATGTCVSTTALPGGGLHVRKLSWQTSDVCLC